MQRIFLTGAAALAICTNALAAGPADSGASATITTTSFAPAAQRVYPPLPSLAMLPPASHDDDEPAPTRAAPKKLRSKTRHVVVDPRPSMPEARLVVSDDSRAYLKDIETRLDAALAR